MARLGPCSCLYWAILGRQGDRWGSNLNSDVKNRYVWVQIRFKSTRSAKELTAVAHTPASRMVRGLRIQTENPAATVMPPDTKGHLMGLLSVLLRRLLTPWHVPMDISYDSWFRTIVLPIAAMEDGHLVAALSAVSLAIATGKLDLCIQGLFGAGKSRTAAILLSGLLALDKEERCHFQVICKEIFFPASALWPVWPGQSTVSVGRKLYRSI